MFHCLRSLLLLALIAPTAAAFAKSTDSTLHFDLYRGYLMVVHGSAGSAKGLNFLFDTGTNPTMLDTRLASRLGLKRFPAVVRVVNGNVKAERGVVFDLALGPVKKESLPVMIEDLSFLQKAIPVRIDGVIGLDTLGSGAFMIDYVAHEIDFGAYPVMPFAVPLQIVDGLAVVDASSQSCFRATGFRHRRLFAYALCAEHGICETRQDQPADRRVHPQAGDSA